MKNRTVIARRKKSASAEPLEKLQQAFEAGKNRMDELKENIPELGGMIYGFTYTINIKQSGLSPLDFKAAGDKLSSMDPEQLARFVGLSEDEIADLICEEHGIGVDDKDFSGGADVNSSEIQIDLYFMGGAQGTTAKLKKNLTRKADAQTISKIVAGLPSILTIKSTPMQMGNTIISSDFTATIARSSVTKLVGNIDDATWQDICSNFKSDFDPIVETIMKSKQYQKAVDDGYDYGNEITDSEFRGYAVTTNNSKIVFTASYEMDYDQGLYDD